MWSDLTSFINPLPGYVENKAGDAERFTLDEIALLLVRFDRRSVSRVEIFARSQPTLGTALVMKAIAGCPGTGYCA
jgi:hypothetical protein